MNLDTLRNYCLSLPHATENLQWGDDLCFKIGGKLFVIVSLESVPQKVCFKCNPETFAELTERDRIVPAPYLGRYTWVLVEGLDVLPDLELKRLIRESYETVAAKARFLGPKLGSEAVGGGERKRRHAGKPWKGTGI